MRLPPQEGDRNAARRPHPCAIPRQTPSRPLACTHPRQVGDRNAAHRAAPLCAIPQMARGPARPTPAPLQPVLPRSRTPVRFPAGGFDTSQFPLPGCPGRHGISPRHAPSPVLRRARRGGKISPTCRQDAPPHLRSAQHAVVTCLLLDFSTTLLRDNPTTRKLYSREPRSFAARQWPWLLRFPVDRPPLRRYCSTCRQRANQPSSQSGNARCRTVSDPRIIQLSPSQTPEFQFSPSLTV